MTVADEIAGWPIDKLPPEVRKELSVQGKSELAGQILEILGNAPSRGYSQNEIIVLYYQRYNEVLKRSKLNAKLTAMVQNKEIKRVRMGYYTRADDE